MAHFIPAGTGKVCGGVTPNRQRQLKSSPQVQNLHLACRIYRPIGTPVSSRQVRLDNAHE